MRSESEVHPCTVLGRTAAPPRAVWNTLSLILIISVAAILQLGPTQAQVIVTYVSGTGNDSNPCIFTNPCRTLQTALHLTRPGGEVRWLYSADNQAVTLGAHGATSVLAADVSGITIIGGTKNAVNLRSLDTDGGGSRANGILLTSRDAMNIDDSVIRRFSNRINTSVGTPTTTAAAVAKNIVTDFGARCNGSGDDNVAFTAFNRWARTWQASNRGLIELQIPHGATCMFNRPGLGNAFADGIKQLRVVGLGYTGQGDGATFSDNNGLGNGWFLGAFHAVYQDNLHSARLATVAAGSKCVTLLNSAQAKLFSVGNYVLISGIDMMGYGFPPNPYFYEYKQIAAIDSIHNCDGTIGASVTFTGPLKNGYKSTWPLYNAGNEFEADHGGPATLYALSAAWDTVKEYRGITFAMNGFQTYAAGRDISYVNAKFTGAHCAIPTQNMNWTALNSDFSSCAMEVDKINGTVTLNGVIIRRINFQSSSVDVFNLTNSTVTDSINGTPKKFVGSGSAITSFSPGAYAFGRSDETICTSCDISTISPMGVHDKGGLNAIGVNNLYTMSDGIIASANTNGPLQWYIPGTHLYWAGQFGPQTPHCQVLDVTQDSTNTYVQTSCSGGFPTIPLGSSPLGIRVHPSPKFTCSNCTGGQFATILSLAPTGVPLGSYFRSTLTSDNPSVPAWVFGTIKTVSFNVTVPYQASGAPNINLDGPFVLSPDGATASFWSPIVNPTLAGLRTVTAATVTGTQSGDNLPIPGSAWFIPGQITAKFSTSVGPSPVSATVEITTDQGIQ